MDVISSACYGNHPFDQHSCNHQETVNTVYGFDDHDAFYGNDNCGKTGDRFNKARKRNNSLGVTNAYKAHQRGNQRDNYFQFSQILKITLIMFVQLLKSELGEI